MIYTVTFNPAVDCVVDIEHIRPGEVNRLAGEQVFFGGKGINVSVMLNELGIPTEALGFCAGFTGTAIEQWLREKGISTDFIHLKEGFTRINIKIRSDAETDLNGDGPAIDSEAFDQLIDRLGKLGKGDTLVLAGSLPKSVSNHAYEQIAELMGKKGVRTAVDTSGRAMLNVLRCKPFLIKPNIRELGDMFATNITDAAQAAAYAAKLRKMGARNVLVSMGREGAILLDENDKLHTCAACRGKTVGTVGAGDSMLAGFLAGLEQGGYDEALKLGTAAGGATAFSEGLGKKELIHKLLKQL